MSSCLCCIFLSGRSPLGGVDVYFYGVVKASSPANMAVQGFGVWEEDIVQQNGTSVSFSTSGSVGAYVLFDSSDGQVSVSTLGGFAAVVVSFCGLCASIERGTSCWHQLH